MTDPVRPAFVRCAQDVDFQMRDLHDGSLDDEIGASAEKLVAMALIAARAS
jgi:hypothetical protein